jgi:hypothetical protein
MDWAGIEHQQIAVQSKLYYLQHDALTDLSDSEVENIFEAIRSHFAEKFQ